MKKNVYYCLAVVVLWSMTAKITELREHYKESQSNVRALLADVEQYRVSDSLQAASVADLQLTVKEYKRYREEDAALIEQMKADIKRLKSASTVKTETVYINTTPISDDKAQDSIDVGTGERTAEYGDTWHNIKMCINPDSVTYELTTKESLLITNHVVPKRFLFFRWGCREVRTDVVSRNPYTKKIEVESITFKK